MNLLQGLLGARSRAGLKQGPSDQSDEAQTKLSAHDQEMDDDCAL